MPLMLRLPVVGLLVSCLLASIAATPADAATVRLSGEQRGQDDFREDIYDVAVLRVRAAAGEKNRMTIRNRGRFMVVRDSRAVLRARRRCIAMGPHVVRCRVRASESRERRVRLGDGDDVIRVRGWAVAVVRAGPGDDRAVGGTALYGGMGDDVLRGGRGPDSLRGGAGQDLLVGGRSFDYLVGGPDRDRMLGGRDPDILVPADDATAQGAATDVVRGGRGKDRVTYEPRRVPVTVRIDGPSGVAGEADDLIGVETVEGGQGPDIVLGSDRADGLWIGEGDRADARGGDDTVFNRGGATEIACGDGTDRADYGVRVLVHPDCEQAYAYDAWPLQPEWVAPDRVRVQTYCMTIPRRLELRTPQQVFWYPEGPFDVLLGEGSVPAANAFVVRLCSGEVTLDPDVLEELRSRGQMTVTLHDEGGAGSRSLVLSAP